MSDVSPISSALNSYVQAASQPALITGVSDDAAANAGESTGEKNVDAVSQDFEAVFLTQMMSAMFEGDEFTAYFGGGSTGDIYKSMLLNEYGKSFARAGGIGIAAVVKQELLKMQEVHA